MSLYKYFRFIITKTNGNSNALVNEAYFYNVSGSSITITSSDISVSSTIDATNNNANKLIDNVTSTFWHNSVSTGDKYTISPGLPNSLAAKTIVNGVSICGEWFQIYKATAFVLGSVKLNINTAATATYVLNISVVVSNDGTNWSLLKDFTGLTYTSNETTFMITTFNTYNYYRFITNHLIGKGALSQIQDLLLYSKSNIYPPRALVSADISQNSITDFSGNITGQIYGNGTYYIKSSTTGYDLYPWYTFDNNIGTSWSSAENLKYYSDTSGGSTTGYAPSLTQIEGQTISGEWIQIQMPVAIEFTHFTLRSSSSSYRIPDGMIIAGSNDGTTWKYIYKALYGTSNAITYTSFGTYLSSNIVFYIPTQLASPTITNVGQTSLTVSWNSDIYATSYTLQQSSNNIAFSDISTGIINITYLVTGLSSQTIYYYRVIATNGLGSSLPSSSSSVTTLVPVPVKPSAPTITNIGQTSLTVNWSSVTYASTYNIKQSTNGLTFSVVENGVTGISYNVTGLTPGTTYYYYINAVNNTGSSENSDNSTVALTTVPIPDNPTSLNITNIAQTTLTISWSFVQYALTYTLQQSTNNSIFTNIATGITSNTYNVTSLSSQTIYYYKVIAVNGTGSSTPTLSISATTLIPVPITPAAPTITNITTNSLTINWVTVTYASTYNIQQSIDNILFTTISSGLIGTSSNITGLTIGQTYYYRIIALNSSGQSTSSSKGATILEYFVAQSSDSSIFIKWIHTVNASNYYVYQNDISYTNLMQLDILPKLLYQSTIITKDIINGYYSYYSTQPIVSNIAGTQTSKYLIKALSVYDDIQYTNLNVLTPNLLTNCIAWYDAADPTTITRDWGGSILNIKNKINNSLYQLDSSSNGTSPRPYYKNGYTGSFFGYDKDYRYSTDYYRGTYINCLSGSFFTATGLTLDRTNDSSNNCVIGIIYTSKNIGQAGLWGADNGSWDRFQLINDSNSNISTGLTNISVGSSLNVTNTPLIYIAALTSTSTSIVRVNGETKLTFTENLGTSGTNLQINALGLSNYIGQILVHEIVVLKGPNWIMNDVYQLEGYFAHKWGITDKLATNHPYKLIRPYDTTQLQGEQQRFTSDIITQFIS